MDDATMCRDGRDDPSAIGYVFVVTLALASLSRWLSDLTAGDEHGGRYDLPLVNFVTWFAFLIFAAIAVMAMIGGACRVIELVRPARPARRTASPS